MNKTALMESQTKEKAAEKAMKRIRDEKTRRKDDKSVDHVLKALDSLGTTEEKLGAMCQKYAEMFNDHRLLQNAVKQAEKKNTLLQKEKEQLQAEHSKAILTRSRLENLCRELQRQNKAVKEECMLKMREEGEKKREVAAKFHSMLSEIGSLLAQNSDKNAKLRDDNLDMSMRLKSVCDQFEKKEQHVENLAKQMQLEMQLADAKLAKAKMEMDIEKETLQKEKQQLLIELAEYKRKVCEMKASEIALREQITMYSEKYEEFHKALLQSNSAIGDFKAEMERMTKHIRRLEKETATWKSRYDAAQRTLAEVTEGKIRSDEALGLAQRRLTALQGICRGLQDQCRQLRGEKKDDPQTEEDYKQLEAQIKEVEEATTNFDNAPCPRRVSCERTGDEGSNVNISDNEYESTLNPISKYSSGEVANKDSNTTDSHANELDNEYSSSSLNNVCQETHTIDNTSRENCIDLVVSQNKTDHEQKDEKRVTEECENKKKLENGEIENSSNLVSCDILKDINGENCDNSNSQENIKDGIGILNVKSICENGGNNIKNTLIQTSLEENITAESQCDVEINLSNVEGNVLNILSMPDKLSNDNKEINKSDNVSILRNDATLFKESSQLNGEISIKNHNSSSNEVEIGNSDHHNQDEISDKIPSSPEDVNQSKSKKKRKMKK